jgi:hypothetical protein
MGLLSQVTGEPCDTETVKHGLVGGGWKSAYLGNSLAAYPTLLRFDLAENGNQVHAQRHSLTLPAETRDSMAFSSIFYTSAGSSSQTESVSRTPAGNADL